MFGKKDLGRVLRDIYFATKHVVIADWFFTTPAVLIQFITGFFLMKDQGFSFSDNWLLLAVCLYFFAGICWVPVVWMQIKMRNIAKLSVENKKPLPPTYWLMNRYWTILGSLAFPAVMVIFYLMVFKPDF